MKKSSLLLFAIIVVAPGIVYGQGKFGQMELSKIEELRRVVRADTHSVLVVRSEIPNVTIASNSVIFRTQVISESETFVYLEPGRQILTVNAEGYISEKLDVFNFQAKKAYELRVLQAKAIPGTLLINSYPIGASVRIDGVLLDVVTPYISGEISPGTHRVSVSKSGYQTMERDLEVPSQDTTTWAPVLQQTKVKVVIRFENDVKEVAILENGEAIGIAPGEIFLEPGTHLLLFQKNGYQDFEKPIEIQLGQTELAITERLTKVKSSLFSRWYFWTGTAAAMTTAFVLANGGSSPAAPLLPEPPDFP